MGSNDDELLCRPCAPLLQDETLDDDDPVDPKHALFGDPSVGVEQVVLDADGPGAREAQPLPTPKGMTPAAWERHRLTHLPLSSSGPLVFGCTTQQRATQSLP